MRLQLLASITSFFLISTQAIACEMTDEERLTLFNQFDTNRDEWLSQEEYMAGEESRVKGREINEDDRETYRKQYRLMDQRFTGTLTLHNFFPINLMRCGNTD